MLQQTVWKCLFSTVDNSGGTFNSFSYKNFVLPLDVIIVIMEHFIIKIRRAFDIMHTYSVCLMCNAYNIIVYRLLEKYVHFIFF